MVKRRIGPDDIVETAVSLVDSEGVEALTLARIADALGVHASALYNHIDGVDALRRAVAVHATVQLAGALRDAAVARTGLDAVDAVGHAYRRFAGEHFGQYATMLIVATGSSHDLTAAQSDITDVLARVAASCGVAEVDAVHAARALQAALHGFVALEATAAFSLSVDADASFAHLLALLGRGLLVAPAGSVAG